MTQWLRIANFPTDKLLPGVMEAVTDVQGRVVGLPIDFLIQIVRFDSGRLTNASVEAPHSGWTADEFLTVVAKLSSSGDRASVFGYDLSFPTVDAGMPWVGYALGNGGQLAVNQRLNLTGNDIVKGLNAYADVLAWTWTGQQPQRGAPRPWFNFDLAGVAEFRSPEPVGITRFPRMPLLPIVPAIPLAAVIAPYAPNPEGAAQFIMWLLSPSGQGALTGLGFPAMRTDLPGGKSWLSKDATGVSVADLRWGAGPVSYWANSELRLGDYVIAALAKPLGERLQRLAVIETAFNGYLSGAWDAAQLMNRLGPMPFV